MKDRLIFDTTDAQTILDSDSVGAFLRASDGTLLTHTDVGGKKALDVRVAEGINVEVDLDAADDSVAAWLSDGAGNALSSTGGALHVSDGGGSVTVDATDLDIRDLAFASDSVTAHQGGTWTIDSITNPVAVTATDLDIRDLDAATDSVESWLADGAGTALTSTLEGGKQALDVYIANMISINDAALANTAIAHASNDLASANTAEDVVASPLANRKYLWVYNNDNQKIYIGGTGVSAATGFPLSPASVMELRAGAAIDIEWVSAKANHNIRTLELS